jgi:hypothetical protein
MQAPTGCYFDITSPAVSRRKGPGLPGFVATNSVLLSAVCSLMAYHIQKGPRRSECIRNCVVLKDRRRKQFVSDHIRLCITAPTVDL